ncbi:o-succinylbenzoate synthase [Tenacibaculum maritimum]|uniref:o-succinylbenzoate synthase n=1 Tax=Tenacibaculum maritimum TaxID=107401 RepID=UPI0012E44E9F|nr:o-succinylbenzoate synthase [Tenacibaculum maritimum]CAA0168326.1 putative O-succinylbenzoate synthase [Tenacibaculum maritimum]
MITATYHKYLLNFKRPSGTSRGILNTKETWFLVIHQHGKQGIGECGLFRGLSIDDRPDYEEKLRWTCKHIHKGVAFLLEALYEFPSIQFGVEQAFLSLKGQHQFDLFPSRFTAGKEGIPINGLIWMGDKSFMQAQIKEKLKSGFRTLKMKIGAIDFATELTLLKSIRKEFSSKEITLRVDANGAFKPLEALEKLKRLSALDLHSIEQPIAQGQWQEMAMLCEKTPLPIALDEELIGVFSYEKKQQCIATIQPQYIILKPSLVGGFKGTKEWISVADNHRIKNWITSALESNIGLNAIAGFTHTLQNELPQGLGTGSLFINNFESPLEVVNGALRYDPMKKWQVQWAV